MGIKRKCRDINHAKNRFLEWLKERKADNIDVFEGPNQDGDGWDYYRHVSAFVGDTFYSVYFKMWNGEVKIDYSDESSDYNNMGINEFYELLW